MKYLFVKSLIVFSLLIFFILESNMLNGQDKSKLNHHTINGFRNPSPEFKKNNLFDALRWSVWERITGKKPEHPENYDFPVVDNDGKFLRGNKTEYTVTWVGHSTLLVQMEGINILTDPIWSERGSPFKFAGPKRYAPPGIDFDDLPEIDLVIISHNHYDHLDKATIKRLGNKPFYLVPLGIGDFLRDLGITHFEELDWWDSIKFNGLEITCTPAQHFSGRMPFDQNKTLWASWVVKGQSSNFYFGGDSGYFPGYKEIGKKFGPFDLVALPIGAYMPRWFMEQVHLSPKDALQAYIDLQGEKFIAIHWGTFNLADEPLNNPPEVLKKEIEKQKWNSDNFWLLAHGETRIIKPANNLAEGTEEEL